LRRVPDNMQLTVLLRVAEARMLVKEGKISAAVEKYEHVLELCPDHRTADRDLTILRCVLAERKKPTE
jgi:predicted TPR repeat methyltransferase